MFWEGVPYFRRIIGLAGGCELFAENALGKSSIRKGSVLEVSKSCDTGDINSTPYLSELRMVDCLRRAGRHILLINCFVDC